MFLSHTVDPKKDTVAALKAYSLHFDADPLQWMFLTGDKQKLYDMARYSYLISAEDDTSGVSIDKDFIHDNHFILVDHHGRIRGFYDGLEDEPLKKIVSDIKTLIEEKTKSCNRSQNKQISTIDLHCSTSYLLFFSTLLFQSY